MTLLGIDTNNFLQRNFDAVQELLPLFDAEFCLNSRYQLTGFCSIQIIVSNTVKLSINKFSIEIPGEGVFQGSTTKQTSRWMSHVERCEGRIHQLNVVMSLIAAPKPNILALDFECDGPCRLTIRLAKGDYRPDSTGMPTERWENISFIDVEEKGNHFIKQKIPYDDTNLFVYPTNFKKYIDGKYHNGYHFVHIVDLAELYRSSKREIFKEYAIKFLGYYERWRELGLTSDYSVEPHIEYQGGFRAFVMRILDEGNAR